MYMRVMKKYEMVSAERQVPGESGENGGRGASGDATVAEEGAWSTEGRRCVAAPRRDARGRAFAERCKCGGAGGVGRGGGGLQAMREKNLDESMANGKVGGPPVYGQRQGRRTRHPPPPARPPEGPFLQHSLSLSAPRSSITLS